MRVAVMTQRSHGLGSLALPLLQEADGIEVVALLHVRGAPRRRSWRRLLRKVARIGPLGAANGVRMRRWYGEDLTRALGLEPVDHAARRLEIPVEVVPGPGAQETADLLRDLGLDVLLSLGNGYIPERVYAVPRLGTVNVHHELLPEFRGAQGVIWQLHEGSGVSGFTIHAVDRSIDTGAILHREEVPIVFREELGATVTATMAELYRRSAAGLPEVVRTLEVRLAESAPQGPGRSFTTPSWSQYRRMVRNHRRLGEEAAAAREQEGRGGDERGS